MFIEQAIRQAIELYQQGDVQAALRVCAGALPDVAAGSDFQPLYGALLAEAGSFHDAHTVLEAYLQVVPQNAEAWSNFGNVLRALGQGMAAVSAFNRALNLNPNDGLTHLNLAMACLDVGQNREARGHATTAHRLGVELPETFVVLGIACRELEALGDAEEMMLRAVALAPRHVEALNHLGVIQRQAGKHDEAQISFERVTALAPDHKEANANLADLHESANRLDEARRAAEKALAQGVDELAALALARIERREGQVPTGISRLVALWSNVQVVSRRQEIAFELGRLNDTAGNSDEAFRWLTLANQIARDNWLARHPGNSVSLDDMSWLKDEFNHEHVMNWKPLQVDDGRQDPIFLVGFPRSGTTLLEQVLDAHPGLQALDEKPAVEFMRLAVEQLPGGYPDALDTLTESQVLTLRDGYFSTVAKYLKLEPNARLVDKYPLNMVRLGIIQRIFPNARFILALRHPCDVCFSCFMQNFTLNDGMVGFHSLESTAAIYDRVMALWERQVPLFQPNVHVLRYEDLVEDFQGEIEQLLSFLDLPWTDAVLDYAQHAIRRGMITTPSYHQVVRPIYKDSKFRWLRYGGYFSDALPLLEPWLQRFKYVSH